MAQDQERATRRAFFATLGSFLPRARHPARPKPEPEAEENQSEQGESSPRPRRAKWQYSIRTLLLLMLLVAMAGPILKWENLQTIFRHPWIWLILLYVLFELAIHGFIRGFDRFLRWLFIDSDKRQR